MRLFFGAFQDDETSRRLWSSARSLDLQGGSRDSPEKYYMTVVFVGQVPEHLVRDVREIGEARRSECITLRFGRWEYWPASRAVVATATDRPEPLMRLRQHLADELTRRGVAFDDKPLRPHITVARKPAQPPVLPELSEFTCTFRAFSLVSSVTAPAGSVYTVVDTWPLLDTAPCR
jgi:2'-5' RNA ligase